MENAQAFTLDSMYLFLKLNSTTNSIFYSEIAVERGIGSATTGVNAMQHFSTRHEANEVFVQEFMLHNVVAMPF